MVDQGITIVGHGSPLEASPMDPVQPTKVPSTVTGMMEFCFGSFNSTQALSVPSDIMSTIASLSINPSTSMVPCTSISTGRVVPDAKVTSTTSSRKSTSSSGCNLRPWLEHESGGLGFNPGISQERKGRGRKSLFCKSKDKARQEIVDGRQASLFRVLRVMNTPGRVLSLLCSHLIVGGLSHPSKKNLLKRLVENISPDILMLQETMGESGLVSRILGSLLLEWDFYALDTRVRSGGLETGWLRKSIRLNNAWGFTSGLAIDITYQELDKDLRILNIYVPYLERETFWENLL
jgi:hypothetical protein